MRNTWYLYIILFLLAGFSAFGQNPNGNYNPFVNSGIISPSPLWPVEVSGTGVAGFNVGNTGSDPLVVYTDQFVTLTITLSYGEPGHSDPLLAVGGSAAGLFSWSYTGGTYTAVQVTTIPASYSGNITIAYRVSQNSGPPGQNGFNVNISPAPYQTASNSQNDDAVSSYTYTEIRDYGDAPDSYGSAWHVLDFENYLGALVDGEPASQPSPEADLDDLTGLDDEDGIVFPAQLRQGDEIIIAVTVTGYGRVNAWIDWNGDGDFADEGERIITNSIKVEGTHNYPVTIPADAIVSRPTFARFRLSTGNISSSAGAAAGGEVEDYRISISASPNAPGVPQGLQADAYTDNSISLSWTASTDNVGVTGYKVYRGGILLGTTTSLTWTDNTVSVGNTYSYTVSAYNAANYESAQSAPVVVTINDTQPPSVPGGLTITSSSMSSVSLSWNASTDNLGVSGYRIYRGGILLGTSANHSWTDNTVSPGNSYTYTVSAFDAVGNESAPSAGVVADIMDTDPPSVPEGLTIASIASDMVSLAWEAATDNVGVTGYRVYRDGILTGSGNALSYTDNTVSAGNSYSYTISALDAANNESQPSAPVVANIPAPDTDAPSVPDGLHSTEVTFTSVSLAWEASTDNVAVAGYKIYRDGNLLGSTTALTWTDNSVTIGNLYSYSVSAFDAAGNESNPSEVINVSTVDTEPPGVPGNLRITGTSASSLSIAWDASADNVGVAGYRLYRGNILLETVIGLVYTDDGLEPGNTYVYTVSAVDVAGNESDLSQPVIGTTPSELALMAPEGLQLIWSSLEVVCLSWEKSSDERVTSYKIYRDNNVVGTTASNSLCDNGVSVGKEFRYQVSATDGNGNESPLSAHLIVNTYDTIPPSSPKGLEAISVLPYEVTLSWLPSTDNVEVESYNIYREGILHFKQSSLLFTDSGLIPGKTYSYNISALDHAGNESLHSETLMVNSLIHGSIHKLFIYPNPAKDFCLLKINQETGRFNLVIFSPSGIIVEQTEIDYTESGFQLHLDHLNKGVYYVGLYNNERYYYGKITIIN